MKVFTRLRNFLEKKFSKPNIFIRVYRRVLIFLGIKKRKVSIFDKVFKPSFTNDSFVRAPSTSSYNQPVFNSNDFKTKPLGVRSKIKNIKDKFKQTSTNPFDEGYVEPVRVVNKSKQTSTNPFDDGYVEPAMPWIKSRGKVYNTVCTGYIDSVLKPGDDPSKYVQVGRAILNKTKMIRELRSKNNNPIQIINRTKKVLSEIYNEPVVISANNHLIFNKQSNDYKHDVNNFKSFKNC